MNHVGIYTTFYIIQLSLLVPCNVVAQTGGSSSSIPSEDQYMTDDTLKVSPGMAILLAGLVTTFFMMGCVSVYARRCVDAWSESTRGGGGLPIRDINRRSGRTRHGLDPKVIDMFPTFLYSDVKGLKIGKAALECAVCLNEFEDEATLRLLPKCCHVFHTDCIDMWLASHVTCPVCRADLVPTPGEEPMNNRYLPSIESFYGSPYSTRSPDVRGQPVNEICELHNNISVGSPEVINLAELATPNHEAKDTSKSPPIVWKLPRSYSTGHSLMQPGQDHERFTLRLPEGVQQMLKSSDLRRVATNAACTFPTERSPKRWFRRSNSFGTEPGSNNNEHYKRFDQETRPDRWEFSITPPFVSRSKSVHSPSTDLSGKINITGSESLIQTVKSPFDQLFSAGQTDNDDVGERSFTRLTGNNRPV